MAVRAYDYADQIVGGAAVSKLHPNDEARASANFGRVARQVYFPITPCGERNSHDGVLLPPGRMGAVSMTRIGVSQARGAARLEGPWMSAPPRQQAG